jgi:hypothetical protein
MPEPTPTRSLQDEWNELSLPLFREDGTSLKFPYNIVAHRALISTLQEVAQGYLEQCREKFALLRERRQLENTLTGEEDFDYTVIDQRFREIQQEIEIFDANLVQTNVKARRKIMDSPGFKELIEEPGAATQKASKIATDMLSRVIQYAVAAACSHSGYIVNIKDDPRLIAVTKMIVPRSFGDGISV